MKNKGFTLIELLVVIAIIGVLAGVLFVAINPTAKIAEGKNAVARTDLSSVSAPIQFQYDEDGYKYTNACDTPAVLGLLAKYSPNATCFDSDTAYAVYIQSKANTPVDYCLDTTNGSLQTGVTNADDDTDCANSN